MNNSNSLVNVFQDYLERALDVIEPAFRKQIEFSIEVVLDDNPALLEKNLSYGSHTTIKNDRIKVVLYPFKESYLIHGVLAREAFNSLLPTTIKDLNPARDLGWEFARLNLTAKDRGLWTKLWKACTEVISVDSMRYEAPFDFPLFSEVTKGEFLKDILQNFQASKYLAIRFTTRDYVRIFLEYYQEYTYKFDAEELRIINFLRENPTASARDIARVFGVPYSKIYRKLSTLRRLQILTQRKKLSYSKLGMITTLVWINDIKPTDFAYKKLLQDPFLFSVFSYLDCKGGAVFAYAFPKHKDNIAHFKDKIKKLQKRTKCEDCFIRHFQPSKAYISQSFSMLLPDQGQWVFNTESWKIWVLQYFESDVTKLAIGTDIEVVDLKNVPLYKFSELDMKVIKEIYNRNFSVRAIASRLKKSPNNIEESLKKLKQLGVVTDMVRVHYLGLSSIIFLYMQVPDNLVLPVIIALKEFPYAISYVKAEKDINEILSFIRISPQIENKVMKALYDVLSPRVPHFEMHIGRFVYWGSYKVPFELWDYKNHSWKPFFTKKE